jgi:hypothetical protein
MGKVESGKLRVSGRKYPTDLSGTTDLSFQSAERSAL